MSNWKWSPWRHSEEVEWAEGKEEWREKLFLIEKWQLISLKDWKNFLKTGIKLLQRYVSFVTGKVWLIVCSWSQITEVNIVNYWNQYTYKIKTDELYLNIVFSFFCLHALYLGLLRTGKILWLQKLLIFFSLHVV